MNDEQLKSLKPGDLVRHKSGGPTYIVCDNFGRRVTAVAVADVTNPIEWDVISKRGEAAEC